MAGRQESNESNDFEVVPRSRGEGEYLSIGSATSGDGNPFERRSDISETKQVLENLKKTLSFKDETDIDQLHEKLKSREALDAGIGGEITNLEDIANNEKFGSADLREAAKKARDHIARVRSLADEKKTTVKRALDILELALPVFLRACELSQEQPKLSEEFNELQELYQRTMQEMLQHQREFQMEERQAKLADGKVLLERSISTATEEREKISAEMVKENENRQLAQFTQAENDVELIIGAEMQELDASLVSCRSDISNIGKAMFDQVERQNKATKNFETRLKNIDIKLEVNNGRQADLMRQLEDLKKEEDRLKDNREFEKQVQQRAAELDANVMNELATLQQKIVDIQEHASTAEEIMLAMSQCSKILFSKSIETQKKREEKLRQLEMEALIRERTALATAAVEFKVQIHMSQENIKEYEEQGHSIRKDIERAANRGQSLTVSKKKQELAEYKVEVTKEGDAIAENEEKLKKMLERLTVVDERLHSFGVSIPEVDTLLAQRLSDMQLESSGPLSLVSI